MIGEYATDENRGGAELARRVEAVEAGSMALEPWEDVRRRIEREILGR